MKYSPFGLGCNYESDSESFTQRQQNNCPDVYSLRRVAPAMKVLWTDKCSNVSGVNLRICSWTFGGFILDSGSFSGQKVENCFQAV